MSNSGKVKRLAYDTINPNPKANGSMSSYKEHLLSPRHVSWGYLAVMLYKKGKPKNFKIHRLVAEAFIPNPDNLPQVNHKDENKQNNCVDNLEWCTYEYNANYGTRPDRIGKISSKPVKCIETNIIYLSAVEAERKTGASSKRISDVCTGKRKTTNGYHWKFMKGDK